MRPNKKSQSEVMEEHKAREKYAKKTHKKNKNISRAMTKFFKSPEGKKALKQAALTREANKDKYAKLNKKATKKD